MFLIANTFAICFNKDYLLTYLLTYRLFSPSKLWHCWSCTWEGNPAHEKLSVGTLAAVIWLDI